MFVVSLIHFQEEHVSNLLNSGVVKYLSWSWPITFFSITDILALSFELDYQHQVLRVQLQLTSTIICFFLTVLLRSGLFSASLVLFSKSDLSVSYLVFETNPLVLILFLLATNLSYTAFFKKSYFPTSLSLRKSSGTGTNLSISYLSSSVFKLAKSDFITSLDVSIPVAFVESAFVA